MTADETLSRRTYLVGLGAVATGSLAGCSGVTSQSFEATPVVLPSDDQEALSLDETAQDPKTISRDGPGGVEVSVTNQTAIYKRAVALGGE